jgi:tRNA A37 methylthiotransferase MiaB
VDLVVLSANLQDDFDLRYFDLIKDNSLQADLFHEVEEAEILIALVSYISITEDLVFLRELKQRKNSLKIYVIGDIVLFYGEKLLRENPFLHGKITDFTVIDSDGLPRSSTVICHSEKSPPIFSIKPQKAELFQRYNYNMPYSRYDNVATVLALNYGCKFICTYCNSNQLTYRNRDIADTMAELKSLQQQGVREVYFRDFTLNAEPVLLAELCEQIIKDGLEICWSCDVRVDLLSEALLAKMKKAGCYLVFFGIETDNKAIARATGKLVEQRQLKQMLKACKREGVQTLGSFLLGLPGDSCESIEQTIRFALSLGLTYASFNVFEQRPGVKLVCAEPEMKMAELVKYQSYANRRFYLRIGKIFELIRNIRTASQLRNAVGNGLRLLKPA